jgi:hypothetical protein
MISIGIYGIDVLCGKKCARHHFVLYQKPVVAAPSHNGIAIPKFIDSYVIEFK